jgi:tetratricopeptide (TPR) repeat protein
MDRLAEELLRCGRIDAARDVTRRLIELAHNSAVRQPGDADLLNVCAWTLLNCDPAAMRDAPAARALAERAAELTNWDSALILDTLALAYYRAGDFDQALAAQRKALEVAPLGSPRCLTYNANLIHYLRCTGNAAAAETHIAKAVAQYRAALGEDKPFLAAQMHDTGVALAREGRLKLAEALLQEALVTYRERLGERHELTAACLMDQAGVMAQQNRYGRSAEIGQSAVALHRELWSSVDLRLAQALHAWGVNLHAVGDTEHAQSVLRESLAIFRELKLENVPAALLVKRDLAEACLALGKPREAERLADEVLISAQALFSPDHLDTALAAKTYGLALIQRERPQSAEPFLRSALRACAALELPARRSWRLAEVRGALGHCLTKQGDRTEAEVLLLQSYEELCDARGTGFYGTRQAACWLADLYEASGRPADAAAWRERAAVSDSTDD